MKLVTFFMIIIFLGITGCTNKEPVIITETEVIVIQPPKIFYDSCPDIPAPPEGNYTSKDIALYIVDLFDMAKKCKHTIYSIKEYVENSLRIHRDEKTN